jgi:hypothetical protein
VRSVRFWGVLLLLFVIVMSVTTWKDWWLTEERPNALFYGVVAPLSITGGALAAFGVARVIRQPLRFLEILALNLAVNTIMQVAEIVLKMVYYRVWQYPGLLYLAVVLPLGVLLLIAGFIRWTRCRWRTAVLLTMVQMVGEMAIGMALDTIPGLQTAGS